MIQVIFHRDLNLHKQEDDIALVRLSRKIDFANEHHRVRCVCDPEPLDRLDLTACITMGWGRTNASDPSSYSDQLLEVKMPGMFE